MDRFGALIFSNDPRSTIASRTSYSIAQWAKFCGITPQFGFYTQLSVQIPQPVKLLERRIHLPVTLPTLWASLTYRLAKFSPIGFNAPPRPAREEKEASPAGKFSNSPISYKTRPPSAPSTPLRADYYSSITRPLFPLFLDFGGHETSLAARSDTGRTAERHHSK